MYAPLESFKSAGFFAWVILLVAMLGLGLVPLALALAYPDRTRRASLYLAVTAVIVAGVASLVGFVGFFRAHARVERLFPDLVTVDQFSWDTALRIAAEGFWEARAPLRVAVIVSVLPLVGSAIALAVASWRQMDRTVEARRIDTVLSASASLLSLLAFLGAAANAWRKVDHETLVFLQPLVVKDLTTVLASPVTPVACARLDGAIAALGSLEIAREVPRTLDAARECIDLQLAPLAVVPSPVAAVPSAPPGAALGWRGNVNDTQDPGEIAHRRLIALYENAGREPTSSSARYDEQARLTKLEDLKRSRLLLDDGQRTRIAELIVEAEKRAHPADNPLLAPGWLDGPIAGGLGEWPSPAGSTAPMGSGAPSPATAGTKVKLTPAALTVAGRLPPEVIQRIIRVQFSRLRACAEQGRTAGAGVVGRVIIRFVIAREGNVVMAGDGGSDLPDPRVVSCFSRVFKEMIFPQPEGGIVTVVSPWTLSDASEAR